MNPTGAVVSTIFSWFLLVLGFSYLLQAPRWVRLSRNAEGSSNPNVQGYYLQGAYRLANLIKPSSDLTRVLGRFEPVVRWGQIVDFDELERKQLALGLNYWLFESVPLKITYEFNSQAVSNDRLFVQFAYGF